MAYDMMVGRDDADREKYGKRGLVFLGKSYVTMGTTTSLANNIFLDVNRSHVILITGKRGGGKCLHGDTLIPLVDGSLVKIKDLKNSKLPLFALNYELKIQPKPYVEFYEREVNETFAVKLRSGREIVLTPEHPLLTIGGWKPTEELHVGSRIATPRVIPAFGKEELPDHEIKLLAYLIAEGHTKSIALFSNTDKTLVKDFAEALTEFDPKLSIVEEREGCYRLTEKEWKQKVTFNALGQHSYQKRSIRLFFEKYGLFGKLAPQKTLPKEIFTLPKGQLALFLNRLFSCDGSIYPIENDKGWEVDYSTSSKEMATQIQHLLHRFGILSKLRTKNIQYKGKHHIAWELVLNSSNVETFIQEIGFWGKKQEREAPCLNYLKNTKRNPNVDTIPKEVWDYYKPETSWAELGRAFNYAHPKAMRERLRYAPARETLKQIAVLDEASPAYLLATSDIFWDEIIEMKLIEEPTTVYDITVPDVHNFVANDIIVHNSYTLSVITEEIAQMPEEVKQNTAVLIFDTMGIFWTMKFPNTRDDKLLRKWGMKPEAFDLDIYTPKGYYQEYKDKGIPTNYSFALKTSDLAAGDWAGIFEVKLTEPIGVLIEKAITMLKGREYSIQDVIHVIKEENVEDNIKNAAINRFLAAESWGLFDEDGNTIDDLVKAGRTTIVDVSCYTNVAGSWGIKNLVIGYLCGKLINSRITSRKVEEREAIESEGNVFATNTKQELPLTWVLLDEAHEALPKEGKTPATDALVQLLREGRQPGISLVLATQQPGEIHKDVLTQTDIVISHKLTAKPDIEALNTMMQSYLLSDIHKYLNDLPEAKGSAIILDDNSERIYPVQVHPKKSWHGGSTPSAIKLKEELFKIDL